MAILEYITIPLTVLILLVLSPPLANVPISAWIAGYLAWVVVEWWMHAVLFHRVFRRQHWVHHLRPTDPRGAPPPAVAPLALGAVVGLTLATAGQYVGAALAGGFLLGYCTYIFTHHAIHAGWLSPESKIAKRHLLHHRGVEKNFNLLNPLGDLIFGTYAEPK
jgi:hypothetical protein